MSKKIGGVVALAAICALSLFLVNCGSSSSRPSGLLYVLTQGSNGTGNAVSSFAIDLNSGNLSLINSNASTCATAGACGLPLNIVLDPTGAAAFVLSQGAISSFAVNSDGSFGAPTNPSPWTVSAGDTAMAMSRDAGGNFLYVITTGNQASIPPLSPELYVFSTKPGSTTLTLVDNGAADRGFVLPRVPTALSAIAVSSPAEELLFVASSKDLSANHNDNTLSVYGIGSDGTVTEKIGSPYATSTIDPLSVLAVNTNVAPQNNGGVFVYVGAAGNASGALDAFQVCTGINAVCTSQSDVDNAKLLPVGTSPTSAGQNPVGIVVDPTNSFLYVVCEGSSQVFGYRIFVTTGVLTAQNPTNLSTGTQPVALAIHSSGKFLYTSNSGSSNISAFTVSTTSGSMSSVATVTSPPGPSGMAAR
jgi:DNA-binding beta-propeller fold protein YncE